MDESFNLVELSDSVGTLLSLDRSMLLQNPEEWAARVHPRHRKRYQGTLNLVRNLGSPTDIDYRTNLPEDRPSWLRDYIAFDSETSRFHVVTVLSQGERAAEERLGYLNKAGRILASTLNSRDLLSKLADLAVDSLADLCTIEIDQGGETFAIARTQRRPRWITRFEALGPLFLGTGRTPPALARGRPIFMPRLTPRQARSVLGEARLTLMAKKRPHSAVVVPISARGRLFGAIGLFCSDPLKVFATHDVELAMEIGRRAGTALENAELFESSVRARERLELDNEAKDEFLGILSHEVRTPLTVIYGGVKLLPRLLPPLDESTQSLINDITSASERSVQLMDDLMLIARLSFGEGPEREPIPTQLLLREVSSDFMKLFPDRLLNTDDSCRALVSASKPFLRQVLFNLLTNANKYSPPGTQIHLSAVLIEDEIVFLVQDSGPGVPTEELESIFERFYRAANSSGVSGVGLGLKICKRFTEAQGGRIWASNAASGGLRVSVALPKA